LRLDVSDTGVGIPPDRMDRLFKPFSQIDASITRLYGGSGLGLSIVKRLAELMGGSASVMSEVDRGSTFSVTFDVGAIRPMTALEPTGKGRRILVVDDNPISRDHLCRKLKMYGYESLAVDGVAAALHWLIDDERFDAVLADEVMPDKGGLDLLSALRADPRFVAMPFILLSMIGTRTHDVELKVTPNAVVLKPTRSAVLATTLKNVLAGTTPRRRIPFTALGDGLDFRTARVLLVEDNLINQRVALHMLKRLGIDAVVANNGAEALSYVQANAVDLVFMDCQMPVMDGFTATRRIREYESQRSAGRHVPIVALTANVMSTDREACIAAGMNEHLGKPILAADLAACITRYLSPMTTTDPARASC